MHESQSVIKSKVALDAIACKIIDLDPALVPTSEPGERAGLGTYHYKNIEVVGEDIEAFIQKDFEVVRKPPLPETGGRMRRFIKRRISPRPTIDKIKCTSCGLCVRSCPVSPKAVHWHQGDESRSPVYNHDHCIRCFCCQELCPEGAITVKETLLGRIFFR